MPDRSNNAMSPIVIERSAAGGKKVNVLQSRISGSMLTPDVSMVRGLLPERHSCKHCSLRSRSRFIYKLSGMLTNLSLYISAEHIYNIRRLVVCTGHAGLIAARDQTLHTVCARSADVRRLLAITRQCALPLRVKKLGLVL